MATPRQRPPAPVAGALVPPLPQDVRAALAEIAGEPFAAAMASRVWPVALDLLEHFKNREPAAQRRAWLKRARVNFSALKGMAGERKLKARRAALLFVAEAAEVWAELGASPQVLRLVGATLPLRWLAPDATGEEIEAIWAAIPVDSVSAPQWEAELNRCLRHPSLRPAGRGMAECAEIARRSLTAFDMAGLVPGRYEHRGALRALRLVGNAAAHSCGQPAFGAAHWRRALAAARASRARQVLQPDSFQPGAEFRDAFAKGFPEASRGGFEAERRRPAAKRQK